MRPPQRQCRGRGRGRAATTAAAGASAADPGNLVGASASAGGELFDGSGGDATRCDSFRIAGSFPGEDSVSGRKEGSCRRGGSFDCDRVGCRVGSSRIDRGGRRCRQQRPCNWLPDGDSRYERSSSYENYERSRDRSRDGRDGGIGHGYRCCDGRNNFHIASRSCCRCCSRRGRLGRHSCRRCCDGGGRGMAAVLKVAARIQAVQRGRMPGRPTAEVAWRLGGLPRHLGPEFVLRVRCDSSSDGLGRLGLRSDAVSCCI